MRRCKKTILAAIFALITALVLSGCGVTGLDAQSLMSPPKTSQEREELYALMRQDNPDMKLVYPKNGEFRSAVVGRDVTKDGRMEAVTFCTNGESGIRLQFFHQDENSHWQLLATFISASNQVDKVFFGDLTGDGQEEVVVGWGDPQSATASVSVYHLQENAVQEMALGTVFYSGMVLTDFDGDRTQELLILDSGLRLSAEEGYIPLCSLYRFTGDAPYVAATVPADAAVIRYSTVTFASVSGQRSAVLADGILADGRMSTQVILYDKNSGRLLSPLYTADAENPTARPAVASATCRDVNGDGVPEIPTVVADAIMAESSVQADSTACVIHWNTYSPQDNAFTPVATGINNTSENYFFVLPMGKKEVVCVNDSVTRTATFYTCTISESGAVRGRKARFSVTVCAEEGWSVDRLQGDETLLSISAGRVYVLKDLDAKNTELSMKTVESSFMFLSE